MKLRILILIALFALAPTAHAATLSVSPGSTSVSTGNIVTVRLVTNTQGASINEAGGTVQFPSDLLDVISVSKSNSIFSLWVEDPSFSNAGGTVSFDGGIPNPGFTGAGTVLTITFHAKKAGTATISVSDAAVRANDGLGTNVLTNSGVGAITISDAAKAPTPPATPAPTTPTATEPIPAPASVDGAIQGLMSPTHPDQGLWYSNASPLVTWTLPEGATAVETIIASTSTLAPVVLYQPAITEKQVSDLIDGTAYFNIRAKIKNIWGPVSSFKLQIDTVAPTIGNPTFSYDLVSHQLVINNIDLADTGSGVAKLELVVDGGEPVVIRPEEIVNDSYRLTYHFTGETSLVSAVAESEQSTGGTHQAVLRVFDQAGNHAEATGAFIVPIALIDQTLFQFFGLSVTLLWFLMGVLLLTLASVVAAGSAWYRLFVLRQSSRTKVAKREQVVHRALSLFKSDLERHIRSLENASNSRDLTAEEERLKGDLTDNLTDLEHYLKKEFKKFD